MKVVAVKGVTMLTKLLPFLGLQRVQQRLEICSHLRVCNLEEIGKDSQICVAAAT